MNIINSTQSPNFVSLSSYRFYIERYNMVKYKNNPYYIGAELWDDLLMSTIECDNILLQCGS